MFLRPVQPHRKLFLELGACRHAAFQQGEELEILAIATVDTDSRRGLHHESTKAPSTDGSRLAAGEPKKRAFELLADLPVGWSRDLKLVNVENQASRLTFEIPLRQSRPRTRIVLPFIRNLKRLGIDARVPASSIPSQYINRIRSFDFDMIHRQAGAQSESPGNEQRDFWSSSAADSPASRNFDRHQGPGHRRADRAPDQVAPTRESLIARTRALDRVLLHGTTYVISELAPAKAEISCFIGTSSPGPDSSLPKFGTSTDALVVRSR